MAKKAQKKTEDKQQPITRKRELSGMVVRKSGDKTIAVEVVRWVRHPIYQKKMKQTKLYLVHDPENASEVGQTVKIREARRLSARKRWMLATASI